MAVSRRAAMALTSENIQLPTTGGESRPTDNNQTNPTFSSHTLHNLIESLAQPDGYEDLPTQSSLIHATAGCTAGIAEHCGMYPVDLVKTRMMAIGTANGGHYSGVFQSLRSIFAAEGAAGLFRGVPVVFMCSGPAHGAYFAAYELAKRHTGTRLGKTSPLGHMFAGAAASLVHDAVMTPVDAIKQRMQKHQSAYKSSLQCFNSMRKQEGIRAFYRSYGTQILMNVPQQSIHFMCYEYLKRRLNPQDEYRPLIHIVSGGVAGGIAAVVTTPLDVCKTLLNTQPEVSGKKDRAAIRGLGNGLRTIYQVAGVRGFVKGCAPRVLTIAPSTAICWWVYEMFKYSLS